MGTRLVRQVLLTAGAIIGMVATVGLQIWSKPDLRYEEGAFVRAGELSVFTLKLKNYGHSDAEKVRISASLAKPLAQVPQTSDDSSPFVPVSTFTTGKENISGEIDRVVPGQPLDVYFVVQGVPSQGQSKQEFISSISYKGGLAKTGQPSSWLIYIAALPFMLLAFLVGRVLGRNATKAKEFDRILQEAVKHGQVQLKVEGSDLPK